MDALGTWNFYHGQQAYLNFALKLDPFFNYTIPPISHQINMWSLWSSCPSKARCTTDSEGSGAKIVGDPFS